MKPIIIFLTILSILFTPQEWIMDRAWDSMNDEQRYEASIEYKARSVRMTVEEFDLFSRTVEAESDRSSNLEGRVLIAEVIFNRVNSSSFPDTITGVCTQSGQFQVVYEGTIWTVGRTSLSDWAIIEASRRINAELAPNVLYFNNSGYAYGTPYCYEGGNYFVTG